MKVHLFGNRSSLAVETFGLRKTAQVEETRFGPGAREFVERNFCVAKVFTLKRRVNRSPSTNQSSAGDSEFAAPEFASNHTNVTNAFPTQNRAPE